MNFLTTFANASLQTIATGSIVYGIYDLTLHDYITGVALVIVGLALYLIYELVPVKQTTQTIIQNIPASTSVTTVQPATMDSKDTTDIV